MQLTVLKRNGTSEPFQRDKAVSGVRKALKGRPVSEDDLARLGQTVEDTLRAGGWAEVPAHEVGLAILAPLRELDEVAYLRFASVYRGFESADDFETEIAMLRAERVSTGLDQPADGLDQPADELEPTRPSELDQPADGLDQLDSRGSQAPAGTRRDHLSPRPRRR